MRIETAPGSANADLCESLVEAGIPAHVETLSGGAVRVTVDGDDDELLQRLLPVMERWLEACSIATATMRFDGRLYRSSFVEARATP
jgi:hypothetical protein